MSVNAVTAVSTVSASELESSLTKGGFDASIYVSEQMNRQMVNVVQDLAYRCVKSCAEHYHFDAEEACRLLGLSMIKVERKVVTKEKVTKVSKENVAKSKSAFPLPYNGEFKEECCFALRQNNGLYTQCTSLRRGDTKFCKSCASTMQKTGAETPEYGTIQQRMAVDIFEYVDPKGRKPIAYTKVMNKYKISEEQVVAEAEKLNMIINKKHFEVPSESKRGRPKSEKVPKEKGTKGRPKKSKKVVEVEGDSEDLFATLLANAVDESHIEKVEEEEDDEEDIEKDMELVDSLNALNLNDKAIASKKSGKSDEEKEKERLAKEAEKKALAKQKEEQRLKEKAEKEAKLAAEKAEKDAKKEAERLAKEAKKKAEEEEKAAKKATAEKAKAEKEAKLAAEKAAKEAAKSEKPKSVKGKSEKPKNEEVKQVEEDEEEPDVVKKIEFEGKKYLKSKKTGIVYDYNRYVNEGDQVVIGKWNENTNKIDFDNNDDNEEEEEDEYDM